MKKQKSANTRGQDSNESGPRVSASRLDSIQPGYATDVITLTTDFGSSDYFVAAMKGVIFSRNPGARVIDITHEIPAQDIETVAFMLFASYRSFPSGAIHVAVVDPGVGSARLPILLAAGGYFFIGPDNGSFSYICDQEVNWRAFQLTNENYFRTPISSTFHGRDIFAPVAAALSSGVNSNEFGPELADCVRLKPLEPERLKNGRVRGRIIHIDRFGNCVTNLKEEHLGQDPASMSLQVNGRRITSMRRFYAEEARSKSKLFAIRGSAGFVEISAQNASAAQILKARRGQSVVVL